MIKKGLLILFVAIFSFTNISWDSKNISKTSNIETFNSYSQSLYKELNTPELNFDVFELALKGYIQLHQSNDLKNADFLTIIDMSKSSSKERLFIVDIKNKKVAHKSVVAHGKNSGMEFAQRFSNKISSYKTSLGFYKTAETYIGKHGLSLRLDGLESSNNNARKRAIVIHAADYVSDDFIKNNGRLGRSLGCPSIPKKDFKQIIQKIKEESILFIYHPNQEYLNASKLVNANVTDFFTQNS
ncbi:MAG: murein L,D-transpeptidase catalytic domain family protein [Flavobacteriaceae bacterium]|nr:murein L,D-transpeptidase catalytic domain family protein [Flavobacteriaceae bacterium]